MCRLTSDLCLFHLLNVIVADIDIQQQRHIFTQSQSVQGFIFLWSRKQIIVHHLVPGSQQARSRVILLITLGNVNIYPCCIMFLSPSRLLCPDDQVNDPSSLSLSSVIAQPAVSPTTKCPDVTVIASQYNRRCCVTTQNWVNSL